MHRNSSCYYFHRFRIITLKIKTEAKGVFGREIEVNQSYFGCKRKVRRGQGSQANIPLFRPLK